MCVVLLSLALIIIFHGVDGFAAASNTTIVPVFKPNSRHSNSEMIRRFTSYHLYFETVKRANFLVCLPLDLRNQTIHLIESYLNMCPSFRYRPRAILRSHISWKPVTAPAPPSNQTEKGGSSSFDNDTMPSSADESTGNNSTAPNKNRTEPTNEKVHDYLILALLMPNHPFSGDMIHTLSTVGPMFPMVSVITGDAYEFQDVASKYHVTSFPAALFFKNGLFVRDSDLRDVVDFAAQLARWTKSLPRTYPLVISPPPLLPSAITLTAPANYSWLQPALNVIPLPFPNLEPFIGFTSHHYEAEIIAFVLATVYTFARGSFFMMKSLRRVDI